MSKQTRRHFVVLFMKNELEFGLDPKYQISDELSHSYDPMIMVENTEFYSSVV